MQVFVLSIQYPLGWIQKKEKRGILFSLILRRCRLILCQIVQMDYRHFPIQRQLPRMFLCQKVSNRLPLGTSPFTRAN